MPLDVVLVVAGLVFLGIALSWFFDGSEARKQARELEADNRVHEHWGIPMELRARRQAAPKRKRSA
jgi:hypothetical protein